MPDERRHESADLGDYEVLDGSDTLDGDPGEDPLDRGVAPPQRWSAAKRFGTTAEEQRDGESLDELLGEEEPDTDTDLEWDGDGPEAGTDLDENEPEEDVERSLRDDEGPDPRAGRLVGDADETDYRQNPDLVARDAGADGGGASAEEAALHVIPEEEEEA